MMKVNRTGAIATTAALIAIGGTATFLSNRKPEQKTIDYPAARQMLGYVNDMQLKRTKVLGGKTPSEQDMSMIYHLANVNPAVEYKIPLSDSQVAFVGFNHAGPSARNPGGHSNVKGRLGALFIIRNLDFDRDLHASDQVNRDFAVFAYVDARDANYEELTSKLFAIAKGQHGATQGRVKEVDVPTLTDFPDAELAREIQGRNNNIPMIEVSNVSVKL